MNAFRATHLPPVIAPATVRYVQASDITLRYFDEGVAGGEVLVFIHALGCDLHLWDAVSAAFTPTHRVVRYDLRGHGASGIGPSTGRIDDHVADLVRLLNELGITSATLIGISLGGIVALATAKQFSRRVQRLVLCATGARIGSFDGWNDRIRAVQTSGLEGIADQILPRWFTEEFIARSPAAVAGLRHVLTRTPAAGYVAACTALRDTDLRPTLPTLAIPALVLSGEHDFATPVALGRELAAGLSHATFALIPNAAHLPPIEQPVAVIAHLSEFLHDTSRP